MSRIVVTGASGFIGSRLVRRLLADGHEVSVLRRAADAETDSLMAGRQLLGDVTQPDSLRGKFHHCDLVFHLAGCTIAKRRADFFRVNRDGTENVVQACIAAPSPPQFLFVSSLAAAGPAPAGIPLSETVDPAPVSVYGQSKLAAERVLQRHCQSLPIQIVRPPSVMGDSDRYMLGLFKLAKAGWVFLPGGTPHRYSLIHVDDLVDAMLHVTRCADVRLQSAPSDAQPSDAQPSDAQPSDAQPGVVHLAQDPPLTFVQTAQLVREHFGGGKVRGVGIPKSLCWLLAGTNSLAASLFPYRPLLNMDKMREGMAGEWMADPRRLTDVLGFQFPQPLQERIRQTAESYHQKGWM